MSSLRPILPRAFVVLGLLLSLAAPFQRAAAAQLSAGGFTTSGRASSASVPRGTTATVTVGVTASTGRAALVDVEVYDAAGRKVVQRFWDSQQFSAGVARSFSLTWAVPVDQGIGTYRVDVGVFGVGWNGLHHWNSGATSLQVTTGTPPPPTTTVPAPTTTVRPPTPTTTTTVPAPTTTVRPPTTTTTVPAPTTTVRPPTSTVAPPVTIPPAGALFAEDFAGNGFSTRFDHGWSGEVQAGTGFGANINDWPGDHDGMCANPNQPGRTIHVTAGADEHGAPAGSVRDVSQAFYNCLPGGDPAKGHLMTSVNTQGYVIAWFSPKQTFTNTRQVCWDQDHAFLGNGTWTQVVFLTATEAGTNPDLGFTSPEFPNNGGVSTPRGSARNGIKINMADFNNQFRMVGVQSWQNGGGYNDFNDWSRLDAPTTDKAPRYTICVTDNENGTLTIDRETVAGGVDGPRQSYTAAGSIPNTPIRVVFEHDNYNVDKHHSNAGEVATNQGEGYTRHWDNIRIS